MIYEFALEPSLVAKWYDRLNYLYFEEKFGSHTRRIVSIYPKDWRERVIKIINNYKAHDSILKDIEIILFDILQDAIKRPSTFSEIGDWLQRAEKENEERPFHAIIAEDNPRSNSSIIQADKLIDQGYHRLWKIPDLQAIPRTPEGIAEAARPILQFSKSVVFIEPYFSPMNKNTQILFQNLFDYTWNIRPSGTEPAIVEIQTKLDKNSNKCECESFMKECVPYLRNLVPYQKKLKLTVKKNISGHQRFHNRYILTNALGIGLPFGYNQLKSDTKETDDLYILSKSQLNERWTQYVSASPGPFKILGSQIIIGNKK